MSEPEDLLGKADAFLKRYHPSSTAGRHDVPVLTEVIEEGRKTPLQPEPPAPAQSELADMERRLKQSILDAVASHLMKTVEEPIKAHLDAHLQRALVALSAQIRTDLETLIRETVARSVAAEIIRMRGPSRDS
jgi:hypothetical protein